MRIDIYSDTVCPWCMLGKRRFDQTLAQRGELPTQISWRAFELNPELPEAGVARASYLAAKMGDAARVAAMEETLVQHGETVGVKFRFDLIERMPNSRRSHLLIAHAARFGCAAPVKEAIMRAYFERGIDIGDIEQLVEVARANGLGERAARAALVLRDGMDGIIAAERHAASLGISGVPTYVFDGQYTVSGAREPAVMTRILDQVAELTSQRNAAL